MEQGSLQVDQSVIAVALAVVTFQDELDDLPLEMENVSRHGGVPLFGIEDIQLTGNVPQIEDRLLSEPDDVLVAPFRIF